MRLPVSGLTAAHSKQVGISLQSDMTHLFGTHWNLEGYWRGRINNHSQFQGETIENTLNKTYTMQMYYDNPDSAWVAGFGRLYLPWAVKPGHHRRRILRPQTGQRNNYRCICRINSGSHFMGLSARPSDRGIVR